MGSASVRSALERETTSASHVDELEDVCLRLPHDSGMPHSDGFFGASSMKYPVVDLDDNVSPLRSASGQHLITTPSCISLGPRLPVRTLSAEYNT